MGRKWHATSKDVVELVWWPSATGVESSDLHLISTTTTVLAMQPAMMHLLAPQAAEATAMCTLKSALSPWN